MSSCLFIDIHDVLFAGQFPQLSIVADTQMLMSLLQTISAQLGPGDMAVDYLCPFNLPASLTVLVDTTVRSLAACARPVQPPTTSLPGKLAAVLRTN